MTFTNVLPTVSGSTAVPAASLPDPSTFFDTIGPEPQIAPTKPSIATPTVLAEAMDGLSIKVRLFYCFRHKSRALSVLFSCNSYNNHSQSL